ncbi:MAG: Hpt domain-containing protein [Gemmatimonadota bacterium]|nr:MAG: Hpt domain-containing protein [Gemmatimonadota bacterium]
MSDLSPEDHADFADAVAAVRKEFHEGLPGRVDTLESMLEVLSGGFDRAAAETFYRQSHSLKGTAGSFGALELVEPAASMSEMGRSWLKVGTASAAELSRAEGELERLRAAVIAYLEG